LRVTFAGEATDELAHASDDVRHIRRLSIGRSPRDCTAFHEDAGDVQQRERSGPEAQR
jgi:hypothetical protein